MYQSCTTVVRFSLHTHLIYIDKMISHLQSYSTAPDPTSLRVHLLNSLQSVQFKGWDATRSKIPPYRADVIILITQDTDIALRLVCNRGDD